MRLFRCAGGVPCPYHLHVNPLYHVCNQNVNLFWENYRISPPYLQFYHKTCTIFVPFFCDICSFCQSPVRKPPCFLEPIPQALFRRHMSVLELRAAPDKMQIDFSGRVW